MWSRAIIFPDLAIDWITQDYPYGRPQWYRPAVEAIERADFLSDAEKDGVFGRNAEQLLEGKIAGI